MEDREKKSRMLWYGDNILSVTVVTLSMKEMIDKLHFKKKLFSKRHCQETGR